MPAYRELFSEDYTDVVKPSYQDDDKLTIYQRLMYLYNSKLERHIHINDYEFWMFTKLAYSNDGVNQQFIDAYYNDKYRIADFITSSDGLQFYVIESRLTKDVVIAFRGTDEWVDWLTNVQLLTTKKRQIETAKRHLENIIPKYNDYHIHFCGHSLGGALAQQMHLYYYSFTTLKLKKTVTFNSAGIRQKSDKPYLNIPIVNYIIEKDIVGNSTGYHYGKVHYVKAKNNPSRMDPLRLFTHALDQFTFNLNGNVNVNLYEIKNEVVYSS